MIRRVLATCTLAAVLAAAPQAADAATKTGCRQHPNDHKACQTVTYRKLAHGVRVRRTRIFVTNASTAGNPLLTNVVVYLQNAAGGILKRIEVGNIYRAHPSRIVGIHRRVRTNKAIVTIIYTAYGLDGTTTYVQTWVPSAPGSGASVAVPGS